MRFSSIAGIVGIGILLVLLTCPRVDASSAPGQKPWRIVYFEGGDFKEFRDSLFGLLTAFHKFGWLPQAPDSGLHTTRELWNWAAEQESPFLRFQKEGYYTSGWENDRRPKVRDRLYRDLAAGKADMVLGMGTWTGLDLKQEDPGVPVVVMAVSDALSAGMFHNDEPGNPPWLHVRMDPERDMRQMRIFHDTVGFQTLGIVYKDTLEGRSYTGLDTVGEVARERNFKVRTCTIPDGKDMAAEEALLMQCYRDLTGEVDAFYVTANLAATDKTLSALVAHALKHRIPTFSQVGSQEVRAGILMCISQINFFRLGDYTARIIMRVMEGEAPGSLPMILEDPPSIAVNMMTAKKIGYDIPIDVLSASDQIFLNIQPLGDN